MQIENFDNSIHLNNSFLIDLWETPEVQKLVKKLNISQKEFDDNYVLIYDYWDSINRNLNPWYDVKRNEFGKLVQVTRIKITPYIQHKFHNKSLNSIIEIKPKEVINFFESKPKYEKLLNQILNYKNVLNNTNLFVSGGSNIERQNLSLMITNFFIYKDWDTCYLSLPSFHQKLINLSKNNDEYYSLINKTMKVDILIIDELAAEKATEFIHFQNLSNILKERMKNNLATMFFSYKSKNEYCDWIIKSYGGITPQVEQLLDLMFNNTNTINFPKEIKNW